MPKTNQMATKKSLKETARLTIVCNSDKKCSVTVKGDRFDIISGFAALLEVESEDNEFRNMLSVAMKLFLDDKKDKKKRTTKKKAAPKKKK